MNLPGKPRTEEEQDYEHQSALVKSLIDKGYSVKQIMDLTDVDGVDLDEETAKEILAYDEAGKKALRDTVSQIYGAGKYVAKSMYAPFSSFQELTKMDNNNPGFETWYPWIFGNALVGFGIGFLESPEMAGGYVLATLGINAVDGVYNLFKHNRDRIVKEKMSELEQITNGEDEEEIFE